MAKLKTENCRGVRIRGVDVTGYNEEAHRIGETRDKILGRKLQEIANSYPDHMAKLPCQPCKAMMVQSVGASAVEKLKGVANHYGVDISSFLKVKLGDEILRKKIVK